MSRFGILTVEEVAQELHASPDFILKEMETGRLKAFRLDGEWRTTEESVHAMIAMLLGGAENKTGQTDSKEMSTETKGLPTMKQLTSMQWQRIDPFRHLWPTERGEPGNYEDYDEAYTLHLRVNDKSVPLVIGFCDREAAGMKNRRRAIVFWGVVGAAMVPVIEFSGANDFAKTGTMASVIRADDSRKHIGPNTPLPAGYDDVPTGIYNTLVVGPYASGSRCVIAHKTDFAVMVRHALLRSKQKGWL